MNIESVREYCLSLPLVAEAFPFDERTLVFRESLAKKPSHADMVRMK